MRSGSTLCDVVVDFQVQIGVMGANPRVPRPSVRDLNMSACEPDHVPSATWGRSLRGRPWLVAERGRDTGYRFMIGQVSLTS